MQMQRHTSVMKVSRPHRPQATTLMIAQIPKKIPAPGPVVYPIVITAHAARPKFTGAFNRDCTSKRLNSGLDMTLSLDNKSDRLCFNTNTVSDSKQMLMSLLRPILGPDRCT